jgi:hypothetical protein
MEGRERGSKVGSSVTMAVGLLERTMHKPLPVPVGRATLIVPLVLPVNRFNLELLKLQSRLDPLFRPPDYSVQRYLIMINELKSNTSSDAKASLNTLDGIQVDRCRYVLQQCGMYDTTDPELAVVSMA